MEEEKYQKELFEFKEPKRSFSLLADILPKADFEGRVAVTVSLEKLVFISIGIVMVMVVVYALGVESGKLRAKIPPRELARPPEQSSVRPAAQVRAETIPAKNILNTAPIAAAVKPAVSARQSQYQAKITAITGQPSRPFTILASTFAKRENAETAAAVLARQGFNAMVTYSQPYYRVCVGAYVDKTGAEAERDMQRVRRIYKDAMFKLR
jgi:cell division septation protein DedD